MTSVYETAAEKILDEAVAIQQVPAPTFEEDQRSTHVYHRFNAMGLEQVERDELLNVYARIPGGNGPPLVASAHLDTVFHLDTALSVRREKQRIHGPGIGDNSLAVAVLVHIKALTEKFSGTPVGDIILVANTREEGLGNLAGIKAAVERLAPENPRAYLVLEGLDIDRIYIRGVGSRRYNITATARGGHSWSDFGAASAVHSLIDFGAALTQLPLETRPKTTLNIGVIRGGRSVNTIADKAHMLLDLRSESEDCLDRLAAQVTELAERVPGQDAALCCERIGHRPAGGIAEDDPLVRLCCRVYQDLGLDQPVLKAGSTDANIPFSKHIPAVCLGLTRGGNTHLESEYIDTPPLASGVQVLLEVIRRLMYA
ncbi:MAG: M20/M25/M40 family metallo-hydrolase [Desulfobacter sp.]